MENKASKGYEALAGTEEYQVKKKKLSAKLASCGPWRGKQAEVLSSDTFRSPGGVSDCRCHSKAQAEPVESECFQAQLVQNNPLSSGELHFALRALHAASLMENYSAHEDLSPWLQPCSDTHAHRTNYRRQNIHHVRKKRIKRSFLKLHQLVQLASSHSLPYKAVPTPHHAR